MELHQLKIFVAVAEERHLTRAAERVFSSQPAVSAQVKSLEEQLGLQLFNRTPKGMQLTPAGEQLLHQARATLSSANQLMASAKALQGDIMGELSIGTNSDLDFLRLPELMRTLGAQHPQLKLSLITSMSPDILQDVRSGKLDSGFFFGPNPLGGLYSQKLADIETAIVAPVEWKARIKDASIADLAKLDWIYTTEKCPFYLLKEALFEDSDATPRKLIFVDTEENIRALIKQGAGLSLLRKCDAELAETEGWGVSWHGASPPCPLSICVQALRRNEPEIMAWLEALALVWPHEQDRISKEAV